METNELELNRWAHSFLGLCWHEPKQKTVDVGCRFAPCIHCPGTMLKVNDDGIYNPDYCSEDSPRSLAAKVEAKAIELVGWELYLGFLEVQLYAEWRRNGRPKPKPTEMDISRQLITAPAITRVQAAKRAVEGIK